MRELISIPHRFPLSSTSLDCLYGGILAWLIALNSRDLHHNRNLSSHLSRLPIATLEECDSNMGDVLYVAPILRVVVSCYITQGYL